MISKFKLTRSFLFYVVLLLCSLGSSKVFASHFAAADMYVQYVGTGINDLRYRVVLQVYKACEIGSIDLSPQETVYIWSQSAGINPSGDIGSGVTSNFFITVDTLGNNTNDTLDQLCPNFTAINSCRMPGSQWPAFVRYTYTDTVTLPQQASDWVFCWRNSARNGGINNLCNPSSQFINIKVGFNNLLRYNNSSPRFTVTPIPYLCINQPAAFFNGPVDPNGDSIRVVNTQPVGCTSLSSQATTCSPPSWTANSCTPANCGPAGEIPYATPCGPTAPVYPFSLTNPIASSTGYTVNALSGVATFTPTAIGKYVIAFHCNEYDRQTGMQMGYVTRDVQVSVLACNSPAPVIDSIPINVTGGLFSSTSGNVILGCPGTTFSFSMQAHSQSATNSVSLSADTTATPGGVFTVTNQGSGNPVGNFSWSPGYGDVGDHILLIQAVDSTCTNQQPIVFRSYLVVLIKVIAGLDAGPDKFGYCALNGAPIQLEASAGITGLNYTWTDISGGPAIGLNNPNIYNPLATVTHTTSYRVFTTQLPGNCKSVDTVTIFRDSSNTVTITSPTPKDPYVLCRPGYLPLTAVATGPAPLKNLLCGVTDTISCTYTDSSDIIPVNGNPSNTQSNYNSTPFYGYYNTCRHQYLIHKSDLLASGVHSSTIRSLSFKLSGFPNATVNNLKISLKCTSVNALDPTTGLLSGTVPVYTAPGPTVMPAAGGYVKFNFDVPYSWDTTQNLIVEVCYANSSTYTPVYTYYCNTGYTSCLYSYSYSGNICGSGTATYGPYSVNQIPLMRFNYCNADTVPFQFTWKSGTFLSDSTAADPLAYVPKTTKYYVSTAGRNGCKVIDSVEIYVPIHNTQVFPKDTAICSGESVILHARNSYTYKWYEDQYFNAATSLSCDNCADPVATPPATRDYYIVASDSVNCSDTFTIHVTVKPLPVVDILNNDTIIKFGQSVQLIGSGAYLYYWSPVASLDNPNIVNPVASPTEPTVYTLTGIGANGCRNFDSVRISIDYRDHLMIPSAFTPNGDGRNDEFRITNLTFQKVMEFRVFNRWGQEIFSTTDGRKGWDGSWKGVTQEMGTYNYIIRIGYPDGYVETYKGDVTLVR